MPMHGRWTSLHRIHVPTHSCRDVVYGKVNYKKKIKTSVKQKKAPYRKNVNPAPSLPGQQQQVFTGDLAG